MATNTNIEALQLITVTLSLDVHLLVYCPGNATRSGDQAPVRANDIHMLVSVSEWTQESLVNATNGYNVDEHALAPEERWKPVDDIGRPSCLPAADHHH